jgi:hypothetical protein
VFVRLGDVVRALRALEARGGSAHLALFERMWGHYAYAALGLASMGPRRGQDGGGGIQLLSMGIRAEPEREHRLVGAGAGTPSYSELRPSPQRRNQGRRIQQNPQAVAVNIHSQGHSYESHMR